MRLSRSIAAGSLVMIAAGCAAGRVRTVGNDSERITLIELNTISVNTAYQAVQRLRPQFLRDRNSTSMLASAQQRIDVEAIAVYVDDAHMGTIDALHHIPALEVYEIRRLSPGEAVQRYGTKQRGTVIAVTRKRGGA